ncbi:MAG TPA: acetyl-CoA carboxylase, carboxyltransferase subunit beta [Candidatus Dormibacteraeota bacterium]|nr:acetyl-CoA carboxylase, carboxyltransferase subunit beta [Candidatus Dormibacteraeota bacterium]
MPIKFPFSRRRDAPADAWTKCPACESQIFNRQLERNLRVCPTCGHHFRMSVGERIDLLLDEGSFTEHDAGLESGDPLGFHDQKPYPDRLEAANVKTGLREAAVWGIGAIDRRRVAIGLFDFRFMGGSMGSVVGEKLARCFETAIAERIPAIVVSASGGARMQEGTLSLLQLAKTTAPLMRMDEAGVPFISVLTDPTTGGVLASFASLGDVIVAEPRALIGFAGARVASGTIGEDLPAGFQSAEFLLEHGFVDMVVQRSELRSALSRILRLVPVAAVEVDGEGADARAWGPIGVLSGLAERLGGAVSETIGIDDQPAASGGNGTSEVRERARETQEDR